MKRILVCLFLFLCTFILNGQEYSRALGIRGGISSGIEFRQFFNYNHSGKIFLSIRQNGFQGHLLYEIHRYDVFGNSQIILVYGAGAHAGYQRWHITVKKDGNNYEDPVTAFIAGADGLLGVEYNFSAVPLSAGLDLKPFIEFGGKPKFNAIPWDLGFTIKYCF